MLARVVDSDVEKREKHLHITIVSQGKQVVTIINYLKD